MTMITLTKYAEMHGKAPVTVRQMAQRGGLRSARKEGRDWMVDSEEPYPDHRRKTKQVFTREGYQALDADAESTLKIADKAPQAEKMPSDQDILAELPVVEGVKYSIDKVWCVCNSEDSSYGIFDGSYHEQMTAWCVMVKRTKGPFICTESFTLIHSQADASGSDDAAIFDRRWTISTELSTKQVMSLYPLLQADIAITQTRGKKENI